VNKDSFSFFKKHYLIIIGQISFIGK